MVNKQASLKKSALEKMTDTEFEAYARERLRPGPGDPLLVQASYCPSSGRGEGGDCFVLSFRSGIELRVPRGLIRGFEQAEAGQLQRVEILGGDSVFFEDLDEGFSAQELAADLFGMRAFFGRIGGRARTPAKADAVRANGKKGGRPRKRDEHPREEPQRADAT